MGGALSTLRWWGLVLARHAVARVTGGPRLPPGSLGLRAVAKYGNDRFYFDRFRKYGPICTVLWSRKLTVCIQGFERGRRLLSAHTAALQPRAIEIEAFVPNGFMRRMRGDVHATYRRAFLDALRFDVPEPDVRRVIRTELDALAARQAVAPATAEQLAAALDRIALRSLLIVCFGLEPGSELFERLESEFAGLKAWVYPRSADQLASFDALRATAMTVARRDHGLAPKSVIGRLAAGPYSPLTDETALGNLIYMVDTGRYDMRGLFRWVLKYLGDNPDVVADLRAGRTPDGAVTPLAEACVLETLRLDQAEGLGRDVTDDFVFEGFLIPRGSALRVSLRESHRNAETFPSPDEYRPCRFATGRFSADDYAPFGIGEHRCIAATVVIKVSTWLVEEIVSRFDWRVAADGPRVRGRYHWEPSPSFALHVRTRGAKDLSL